MSEKSILVCAVGFVWTMFVYFCYVVWQVWQLITG